jgi:hypothetical protein
MGAHVQQQTREKMYKLLKSKGIINTFNSYLMEERNLYEDWIYPLDIVRTKADSSDSEYDSNGE